MVRHRFLCLIEAGIAKITNSGSVGPFPVRIPMIDVRTVGTGGGSIAWITREGHLKVGPKSAGAIPVMNAPAALFAITRFQCLSNSTAGYGS